MGKFKDIDVVDAIKAMKTHIENGRMSLLVGSGASCCACKLYQDWYGLIKDMVAFLYADELKAKGVKVEQDKQFYCHYTIEKAEKTQRKRLKTLSGTLLSAKAYFGFQPSLRKGRG